MGYSQERIARIKAAGELAGAARQDAKTAREVVAANGHDLFELLASGLLAIADDWREELPEAKAADLRAERLNVNNVTVSTKVYPLVRLEVIYHPGIGVNGTIQKTLSGLAKQQIGQLSMIRFAVDPEGRLWFTDGERYLHPVQVAEELMEEIAKFFEALVSRPKVVA